MIPSSWPGELDERNRDNVSRTDAYLEMYTCLRERGVDLPWVLMAHLVSRNAGYLMSDLARKLEPSFADAGESLFLLLERANWLIFVDAWHHLCAHLLGRALESPRVPRFMIDAWARSHSSTERELVMDLVHNEQHLIEHRAVHHAHLAPGARLLGLIEASGREKPLHFAIPDAPAITVGGFASIERRIDAGARIYDLVLASRDQRDQLWAWARAHPHTGSRAVYGGRPGPTVREAWPVARVESMWDGVHAPMEPDASYP